LKALLTRKNNSRDRSPASNILKALLARNKQFEGPKPCLEYLEGAAGPKRQFKGPKPCLEYPEGGAGPKRQFEGPKLRLEYLEGAAGPKRQFKTTSIENSLEGASIPCPKKPIRSVQQKTESSKNLAYIWVPQKRRAPKPRREPSREIIRVQGVHTFEVRKNSY
jgi:hypothetical protein